MVVIVFFVSLIIIENVFIFCIISFELVLGSRS